MTLPSEHPANDELIGYLNGMLDEKQSLQIDSHLRDCLTCNAVLENIPPGNSPLIRLIQSAWNTAPSDDPGEASNETIDFHVESTESLRAERESVSAIGKYEVIDELGRGGMGVVYRAIDTELKRHVALKVIIAGDHSSKTQRERFRHEAKTIARLKHSGIVQIYEVSESDGQPFLALELVDGPNLSEISKSEAQPIRWAVAVTLQLTNAIHYAHGQSVVHRDLKPGNVLVLTCQESEEKDSGSGSNEIEELGGDSVPQTKITDFGLAKQLDSDEQMTKTGHALGTPAYMAPEQAAGNADRIGPATDIYALGVILYELLTGKPPIEGHDPVSTMLAVIETDPESPRERRRSVPRDLETICMKCLMKRPEERYESARALGRDLELFLAGEPILATPPNVFRRLYRWARHHPQLTIGYLGCIALYGLHLFAKFVLNLPFHHGDFGTFAPYVLGSWAILVTITEILSRKYNRLEFGQLVYMGVTIVWMSVVFSFDNGPRSAPIPMFFIFIACSTLIVPRSSVLWFVTITCCLCYTVLAVHAHYVTQRGTVLIDEAIGFVGSLILIGVCMQLILRQSSSRNRRDESWKSEPPGSIK